MNLSELYRKKLKRPLRIYWWRYEYPEKLNFGDEITPLLIEKIFKQRTAWAEPSNCQLVGAGSIIEVLQQNSKKNPIHVWGSGFIRPGGSNDRDNLIFDAVRGNLSLSRIDKNVPLGDPGILASVAFPEIRPTLKKYKIGLLPHYVDYDSPALRYLKKQPSTLIINPLWPVEKVLKSVVACEIVFSSSLHGLIVSDSFGIPNYWMPLSDSLTGGSYKFKDYYSAYGEKPKPVKPEELVGARIDALLHASKPRKSIQKIQEKLIEAFPFA